MINTLPRQWMNEQRRSGHELCLVLDSQNERETRQLLLKSSEHDQYLNVYNATTLANLADAGPFIFTLEQSGDRRLDDLLDHPERNWGWLASVEKGALRGLVNHWQQRLIVGTRCDTITQHAACSLAIQQKNGLPDRPPLLAQIFQAGNHSMTGGYVPACWAVLLRWKVAHESKKSRVTDLEFDSVARSLARITRQLRNEEDNLPGRSDAYARTRENVINALRLERSKIETTVNRLKKIQPERISAHALYGSLSEQPEALMKNVDRWLAHPENKVEDPFAVAPEDPDGDALTASIYGHTVGAAYTLDIDSIC